MEPVTLVVWPKSRDKILHPKIHFVMILMDHDVDSFDIMNEDSNAQSMIEYLYLTEEQKR